MGKRKGTIPSLQRHQQRTIVRCIFFPNTTIAGLASNASRPQGTALIVQYLPEEGASPTARGRRPRLALTHSLKDCTEPGSRNTTHQPCAPISSRRRRRKRKVHAFAS